MAAFSGLVNTTGVAAYPAEPSVVIPFDSATIFIRQLAGESVVSFDGQNDHFDVQATDAIHLTIPLHGARNVWLKAGGGGGGNCRVSAI